MGSKARDPLGQQDKALTAWGSQEAGDRALLYGRSTGAKALPPAPRNAAAVLIRSLPRRWRPWGPLDALPGSPASGWAGVSVPASKARPPQPALGGRRGLQVPRGCGAHGDHRSVSWPRCSLSQASGPARAPSRPAQTGCAWTRVRTPGAPTPEPSRREKLLSD